MSDEEEWEFLMRRAAGEIPNPPVQVVDEGRAEVEVPISEPEVQEVPVQMASPLQTIHHVVSDDDHVGLETRGRQKRKTTQGSAGEPSPVPKKKKKSKGKHKHGSSLDLDPGFVKRSYAEYEADPVQAVVNVIQNMADIAKGRYEGNYYRCYFPM